MSSCRDSPFSFATETREYFGSPDSYNVAVRCAFPTIFDQSIQQRMEVDGGSVRVKPGASVSAGEVVGLLTGSLFVGTSDRGSTRTPLPMLGAGGVVVSFSPDDILRTDTFSSGATVVALSLDGGSLDGGSGRAVSLARKRQLSSSTPALLLAWRGNGGVVGTSPAWWRAAQYGRAECCEPQGGSCRQTGWPPLRALSLWRDDCPLDHFICLPGEGPRACTGPRCGSSCSPGSP
jgi:hypothetical protein